MYCAIYKSEKKELTYLYLTQKDDFSSVPEPLLAAFGKPKFVMLVNIEKRQQLAGGDAKRVMQSLQQTGYYLQLPPPLDAGLQHIRINNTKL